MKMGVSRTSRDGHDDDCEDEDGDDDDEDEEGCDNYAKSD